MSGSNQMPTPEQASIYPKPLERCLRVYAIDPGRETDMDVAPINISRVDVPWEPLTPGPVGEYLEVVDIDPPSQCVYDPVDLNDPHLLATDGLPPSNSLPQFHQQMTYAVAMKTIEVFERALGRKILWSERRYTEDGGLIEDWSSRFVKRLRIYPHAIRAANAYYSPERKALLFGYFSSSATVAKDLPGGIVFTCASHDIIVHETTHAILDGLNRRLLQATNEDMLAFHEGFADIVAIFQHFTLPGLVEHQIRQSRGDLDTDGLLSRLAIQFAHATNSGNALRDALGRVDPKSGRRLAPDITEIDHTSEPHARGSILVAAVFDAFLETYNRRIADLKRIASEGRGILPAGALHPDLVGRFADEAVSVARRLLNTCIAALDYLPPVDISFGDYLRALITADSDIHPSDALVRRAIIEGFRRRGIYPRDVRSMSIDGLTWKEPDEDAVRLVNEWLLDQKDKVSRMAQEYPASTERKKYKNKIFKREKELKSKDPERRTDAPEVAMEQTDDLRESLYFKERMNCMTVRRWLLEMMEFQRNETGEIARRNGDLLEVLLGINFTGDAQKRGSGPRSLEVHSVRVRYQQSADGRVRPELVVMVTQREVLSTRELAKSRVYGDPTDWVGVDGVCIRGGCTLIIDPDEARIRYAIVKKINSARRRDAVIRFHRERLAVEGPDAAARYDFYLKRSDRKQGSRNSEFQSRKLLEPFAALHADHRHL
jgi:hypothetical protein